MQKIDAPVEQVIDFIILAGGKGKRLNPLTRHIQKTMIWVKGKPIMQHIIDMAKEQGIFEFIICTGYKKEDIINYFGDGSKFGIKIYYSNEFKPKGTGGCLKLTEGLVTKKDFLVINGDTICNFDIKKFYEYHKKHNSLVTLITHKATHPEDSDLIEIDHNYKVTKIWLKPHKTMVLPSKLSNTGIYLCKKEVLNHIPSRKISFERQIIPSLLRKKHKIMAYYTEEMIKDVGTKDRLNII